MQQTQDFYTGIMQRIKKAVDLPENSSFFASFKYDFQKIDSSDVINKERMFQIYSAIAKLAESKRKFYCYLASDALALEEKGFLPQENDNLFRMLTYVDEFGHSTGMKLVNTAHSVSTSSGIKQKEEEVLNFLQLYYDNLPPDIEETGRESREYFDTVKYGVEALAEQGISLLDSSHDSLLNSLLMLANANALKREDPRNSYVFSTSLFHKIILLYSPQENGQRIVNDSVLQFAFYVGMVAVTARNSVDKQFIHLAEALCNLISRIEEAERGHLTPFDEILDKSLPLFRSAKFVYGCFKPELIEYLTPRLQDFKQDEFTPLLLISGLSELYSIARMTGRKIDINSFTERDKVIQMLQALKLYILNCYHPSLLPSDLSMYLGSVAEFDISPFQNSAPMVTDEEKINFVLGARIMSYFTQYEQTLKQQQVERHTFFQTCDADSKSDTNNDSDSDNDFQSCLSESISSSPR